MVNVTYIFPIGTKIDGEDGREVKVPGLEFLPRKDESVLFIDKNGEEFDFTVHHVTHWFNADEFGIQVVL